VKPITSDYDRIELASIISVLLDGLYGLEEIHRPLGKGSYLMLLRDGRDIGHWLLGNLKYHSKQYQGVAREFCRRWCLWWIYCKQKNKHYLMQGYKDLDLNVI
ncbi:TPA: hypothetical protein N0F65_001695, partial [Lagenidium giganteum]